MCGRYTLRRTAEEVAEAFEVEAAEAVDWAEPRYNIAPTQEGLYVRGSDEGVRELSQGRWGLVPSWADDPEELATLINARSETVAEKPAFRDAFRRSRCLVPADGFYEWQEQGSGPKQPFHLRLEDDRPFAFAGLWEEWGEPGSEDYLQSYTILTTDASDLVATVHDRQPAFLEPDAYDWWLTADAPAEAVAEVLEPVEPEGLEIEPVSRRVNDPSNDDRSVLDRSGGW